MKIFNQTQQPMRISQRTTATQEKQAEIGFDSFAPSQGRSSDTKDVTPKELALSQRSQKNASASASNPTTETSNKRSLAERVLIGGGVMTGLALSGMVVGPALGFLALTSAVVAVTSGATIIAIADGIDARHGVDWTDKNSVVY